MIKASGMWAIYWRATLATILTLPASAYLQQGFMTLDLLVDTRFFPTVFWLIMALVFMTFTVVHRHGITYLMFGQRLAHRPGFWRQLNRFAMVYFCVMASAALLANQILSPAFWAHYKLFAQPALLLCWPWLAQHWLRRWH